MMLRRIVLIASVVAAGSASRMQAQRTACDFQSERLRIDSIVGIGTVMYAGGGVVIRCPSRGITIRGDSAQRFADHDQMIGHAVYDEPRFHVTADYLNYFQLEEKVVAVANVHARMANGSTLDGPQAEYLRAVPRIRTRAQMRAIARPTITVIEKDSAGKAAQPMTVISNTVFMDGDSTNSQIYAGGQVVITRSDIQANADSAFLDQNAETMRLMRNPVLRGKREKPYTLSGGLIDLFGRNKKLARIISRGTAKAVSDSMTLTADTIDLRVNNDLLDHAYAWGGKGARVVSPAQNMDADSLDVLMPNQRIRTVRALRKAFARGKPDSARFLVEAPDTTDWIRGDTIVAQFDSLVARDTTRNPPIKRLVATGHASSLYHMAPADSAERRAAINHVTARVITISFNASKVATVTTVDSVSGVYIEPKPDSTMRRRNVPPTPNAPGQTPRPTVPSAVPLPTRPPPTRP
jgi:hypothetical protein